MLKHLEIFPFTATNRLKHVPAMPPVYKASFIQDRIGVKELRWTAQTPDLTNDLEGE